MTDIGTRYGDVRAKVIGRDDGQLPDRVSLNGPSSEDCHPESLVILLHPHQYYATVKDWDVPRRPFRPMEEHELLAADIRTWFQAFRDGRA
jgi:hypothetical protein